MRLWWMCMLVVSSSLFAQVDTVKLEPATLLDTIKKQSVVANQLIDYAKEFLGTPYRYAGSTPSGFDCSGFVNYVFKQFGIPLVRSSYSMAELGIQIKLSEVQPGDLLFFKGSNSRSSQIGHVAIVTENTDGTIKFIHSAGKSVRMDVLNNSAYYVPRFVKAKRMITP